MKHIQFTRRAEKDLRLLDKPARRRIVDAVQTKLATDPPPENLDIKALRGAEPWLRMRIGVHRVLYRPLTDDELRQVLKTDPEGDLANEGYLVDRIVHRRDLDKAIDTL